MRKRGMSWFSWIILILILVFIAYLVSLILERKDNPDQKLDFKTFAASIVGMFRGAFSYVGYKDVGFFSGEYFSHILAIIISSILLTIIFGIVMKTRSGIAGLFGGGGTKQADNAEEEGGGR